MYLNPVNGTSRLVPLGADPGNWWDPITAGIGNLIGGITPAVGSVIAGGNTPVYTTGVNGQMIPVNQAAATQQAGLSNAQKGTMVTIAVVAIVGILLLSNRKN